MIDAKNGAFEAAHRNRYAERRQASSGASDWVSQPNVSYANDVKLPLYITLGFAVATILFSALVAASYLSDRVTQ
ncbi:hypothetical protein [Jiella marina]|uniref:hypothetical protein n=1 Tax=Jiella sp. LLJ827 TaxID=2917712 RepID=UPI0021018B3C|nr:hypothetical protein [Jiella sp. LLJ827]MCQ0987857.1 hypothetical protein [Jiella sp. LLJ827]